MKKPEEIKIGGVYDVRVKVIKKMNSTLPGQIEIGAYTVDRATNLPMEYEMTWFISEETPAFSPINSENGITHSDPASKYDPCRFFRKGDKVRIKTVNGRDFNSFAEDHKGKILTVLKDEEKHCNIFVETPISDDFFVNPAYLELVFPVEELEPYSIDPANTNVMFKHGEKFATFEDDDEAQKLCDRLNAEYRKEQTER